MGLSRTIYGLVYQVLFLYILIYTQYKPHQTLKVECYGVVMYQCKKGQDVKFLRRLRKYLILLHVQWPLRSYAIIAFLKYLSFVAHNKFCLFVPTYIDSSSASELCFVFFFRSFFLSLLPTCLQYFLEESVIPTPLLSLITLENKTASS